MVIHNWYALASKTLDIFIKALEKEVACQTTTNAEGIPVLCQADHFDLFPLHIVDTPVLHTETSVSTAIFCAIYPQDSKARVNREGLGHTTESCYMDSHIPSEDTVQSR